MVAGFPSNVYYINYIVGVIFKIFLTISTIFLNSVTILAYRKSALLKSKKAYFLQSSCLLTIYWWECLEMEASFCFFFVLQTTEVRGAGVRGSIGRTNRTYEIQNIKMTKSCGIVVGLTFLCNVPYAVTNSLPTSDISSLLGLWSTSSALGALSLNSLVLFWNNPVLRKEAKKLSEKRRQVI